MERIVVDGFSEKAFIKRLKERVQATDREVVQQVSAILQQVQMRGDEALVEYTETLDQVRMKDFRVSNYLMKEAYESLPQKLKEALEEAKKNIVSFHEQQKQKGFIDFPGEGILRGQMVRGLNKVGIYVPGGRAAYPSTVLMNALPAKIAGVKEIIMVSPPQKDGKILPVVLAAAYLAGVDQVYAVGGAQAIAALAYGTETIPSVDKIVGPGNIYVATAKKMVFGTVDIDMIAGPSEIFIVADENADPEFIAADLLSQAEHDPMSSSMLATHSRALTDEVEAALLRQCEFLERKDIAKKALDQYGAILLTEDVEGSLSLANALCPEHLELMVKEPLSWLSKVENAGAVFLGSYSPEPLGDYFAGPNHVLPTGFTARFFSPLSVDSFLKRTSYVQYSKEALIEASEHIITIAQEEGLTAHANTIKIRCQS